MRVLRPRKPPAPRSGPRSAMPQAEPSVRRPHVRRAREASEPPSPMAKGAAQVRRQPTPRERRSGRPSVMPRVVPLAPRQPALRVPGANGRRLRTARGAARVQQPPRPVGARSARPLETRRGGPQVPQSNVVDRALADRVGHRTLRLEHDLGVVGNRIPSCALDTLVRNRIAEHG